MKVVLKVALKVDYLVVQMVHYLVVLKVALLVDLLVYQLDR